MGFHHLEPCKVSITSNDPRHPAHPDHPRKKPRRCKTCGTAVEYTKGGKCFSCANKVRGGAK